MEVWEAVGCRLKEVHYATQGIVRRHRFDGCHSSHGPAAGLGGSSGPAGPAGSADAATAGSDTQPGSVERSGSAHCALSGSTLEPASGGHHLSAGSGPGLPVGTEKDRKST